MSYATTVERLVNERKSILLEKPADMKLLKARLGARGQNLSVLIYAAADTGALVECLSSIRATALEESSDLPTLISLTRKAASFWGSRFKRYYHLETLHNLVNEAIAVLDEVKTKEEFITLVQALASYVGKMNYWVDLEIPWGEITKGF
jgi:hypothetical protein